MHRYDHPQIHVEFHDQRIRVGYHDQLDELKLDNGAREGESSTRQTGAFKFKQQHTNPYIRRDGIRYE